MQQRVALISTALAGVLVTGVAVGSAAHGAPEDNPAAHKFTGQVTGQQVTGHQLTGQQLTGHQLKGQKTTEQQVNGQQATGQHGAKSPRHMTGKAAPKSHAVLAGKTTASYFWDDGSGVNGDTGAPAGGKPMQKGLFASPSWPMHTKVKVTYKDRSVTGFVGDRGPGEPSHRGVMLDLDTYTFRHLVDGKKPNSKYDTGTSAGHLKGVKYEVLSWGHGAGKKGAPKPLG
ncbi:septal ring lytic transglycosylase RlpA family protein [Actinomadura sp. WMMA1423]|uniref:septal ring lytic transglycosylase RlpA family protein n=1 Tax=Actinomadura sp. WMMA1423 TaxID=2591108 RepID=UPI001F10277A|nr:septal ring lytic transglycosylase RlpA family protein [Actinomadura sp. WMMA1423]